MLALRLLSEGGEGPNTELVWLLMILFGLFGLAVLVGWWAGSRKQEQVPAEVEALPSPSNPKTPDDLTVLEGIGPKVARVLGQAGITTFEDLAKANPAEVQNILNEAGLQMMEPDGWIAQAKLAVRGDTTALAKLQRELKGGRKKK